MGDEWIRLETILQDRQLVQKMLEETKQYVNQDVKELLSDVTVLKYEPRYGC